jgi:hypothetical protein
VGQPGDFSTTYHDVASLRGSSTLVDWLITFQSPAEGAAAHALAEWKKTQQLYWLLAAITKATGNEPEAAGLVDAAGQVKPDSPAWESLTYHRLRLLIAMGKTQEARTLLNQILPQIRTGGRDSSVNAYLGLRMRAAENLSEFLMYAPRKMLAAESESQSSLGECLEVMKDPRRQYDCAKEVSPVEFSADAASFFNTQASLNTLVLATAPGALPEQLRRSVAMMGWVRSVLLKDDAATAKFFPLLPVKLQQQAGGGTGFHALVAITRYPGLRPYLDAGVQRSYSWDFVESYRYNWWGWDWGGYGYGDYKTPLARMPEPFLTPAQSGDGERETETLMKLGGAKAYLGGQVLAYANDHPSDPDVPESLYLVLRMIRYGADSSFSSNDAAGKEQANQEEAIRKAVSRLLRQRFAANPWTKKSAPFAE